MSSPRAITDLPDRLGSDAAQRRFLGPGEATGAYLHWTALLACRGGAVSWVASATRYEVVEVVLAGQNG